MQDVPSERTVVLSGELRELIGELETNRCHGVICDGPAAISAHLAHSKPNAVGVFLGQSSHLESLNEISQLCQENDIPILLVCESTELNVRIEAIQSGYPHVFKADTPNSELVAHLVSLTKTHIHSARERQFESIFQNAPYGILLVDEAGSIFEANESVARMLALSSPQQMVGRPMVDFIAGDAFKPLFGQLEPLNDGIDKSQVESILIRGDGQHLSVTLDMSDYELHGSRGTHVLVTDSGERKRLEDQINFGLFFDRLTQLPNRTLLLDRISRALLGCQHDEHIGILLVDVNRFRSINERFGHQFGDQLLVTWAGRLRKVLQPTDTLARIGVDDFAIVRSGSPGDGAMMALGRDVEELARHPFRLPRETINLSATVGIALSEPGATDAGALLQDGQTALFKAKSGNRSNNRVLMFNRTMRAEVLGSHRLMNDLPQAIGRDELFLQYQPVVDILEGRVVGLEALVRWNHPQLGLVPPTQFIPAAESSGLVLPLGRWVLERCCQDLNSWLEQRIVPADLMVNANVATHQLVDPDLVPMIADLIRSGPVTAKHLNLELTESALMENPGISMRVFSELDDMGIKLYVDDFGTGYSSFSYLTQLPISALKIDRSFISRMNQCSKEKEVVRSIVLLAKNLGLRSVAEGVEERAEIEPLKQMGCDCVQGYYYSRPVDAEEVSSTVARIDQELSASNTSQAG